MPTALAHSSPRSPPFKVIGHAGMRTTTDGALIIKPAFPTELQFYETLSHDHTLAPLRPYVPRFLGTLATTPTTDDEGYFDLSAGTANSSDIPIPPGRTEILVLENLCNEFVKPNTLDVKLGTVFHDDSTDPDKVLRMEKTARETTSLGTGVRLTEFQVYDNRTSLPICTPKSYGKAIKVAELPEGIARFFPVYNNNNATSLPRSTSCGLPRSTLVPILRGIRDTVARLRDVYAALELRIIGGSLLIMYEADWCQAEEGVKRLAKSSNQSQTRQGNGQTPEDGVIVDTDVEGNDDISHTRRPPFLVRLVDFAHTRMEPGIGPDEGVLMGLDTTLKLLDGRIQQLVSHH